MSEHEVVIILESAGGMIWELPQLSGASLLRELLLVAEATLASEGRCLQRLFWGEVLVTEANPWMCLEDYFGSATGPIHLLASFSRRPGDDKHTWTIERKQEAELGTAAVRWSKLEESAVRQIKEGRAPSVASCRPADLKPLHMEMMLQRHGYELPGMKSLRPLGVGGFASVLKVCARGSKECVALKRQCLGNLVGATIPAVRELTILDTLRGVPHTVQMHDAFLVQPQGPSHPIELWTVLELYKDSLWGQQVAFVDETAAKAVITQVVRGLHALHSRDIVHRDLKPENVLVEPGPPLKAAICDFGLSRSIHDFSTTLRKDACVQNAAHPSRQGEFASGSATGTPRGSAGVRHFSVQVGTGSWRAPETCGLVDTTCMTKDDYKSLDVFALGLIWAELLTGQQVLFQDDLRDPPQALLLETLCRVNQPTDDELQVLGYQEDALCFIRAALHGDMQSLRGQWSAWGLAEEFGCRLDEMSHVLGPASMSIESWIVKARHDQKAVPLSQQGHKDIATIQLMTRFSYRSRPCIEDILQCFNIVTASSTQTLKATSLPRTPERVTSARLDVKDRLGEEFKRMAGAQKRRRISENEYVDDSACSSVSLASDVRKVLQHIQELVADVSHRSRQRRDHTGVQKAL
mmetsp:Transcript_64534/g.120097  ORF Transcript_64534/g.120097 Transcript_64534/m.120097 type:complete len:636 (-) Transcript_64534:27-1934(-)